MRRILLLGKNGQVGWEMHRALLPLGEVVSLDAPDLNFLDLIALEQIVLESRAEIIINSVAYTAVDPAESDSERVMKINAAAPGVLAEAARKTRAVLVHISTDFVFDGKKRTPYTEEDEPGPLSVYAESKAAGDLAVQQVDNPYFILRSSWIFSTRRDNFILKVMRWARKQKEVHVVADQVGSPTWARLLAEVTAQMFASSGALSPSSKVGVIWDWARENQGLYNVACAGSASRFDWAEEILRNDPRPEEHVCKELKPVTSAEFPTPATRPMYSVLDSTLFSQQFGLCLPHWRDCLRLAMQELP